MTAPTRAITPEEAGRNCPYCRFALKAGTPAVACPSCEAPHHTDCWEDNGGCAIVGCPSGPASTPSKKPVAPPPTAVHQPPPPPIGATAAASPASSGSRKGLFIGVGTALVLAVTAGGVGAVLLTRDRDEPPAQVQVADGEPQSTVVDGNSKAQQPTVVVESVKPNRSPRSRSRSTSTPTGSSIDGQSTPEVEEGVQQVLADHHRAIARGDLDTAWQLTSQRYRAKKLREDGRSEWDSNMSEVSRYLDPDGLQVEVVDTNSANGVATVRVTGMGWSRPGSSCSRFEGITWAKYDDGAWRYEPGYSMSDQRRAEWYPRRAELLGWGC